MENKNTQVFKEYLIDILFSERVRIEHRLHDTVIKNDNSVLFIYNAHNSIDISRKRLTFRYSRNNENLTTKDHIAYNFLNVVTFLSYMLTVTRNNLTEQDKENISKRLLVLGSIAVKSNICSKFNTLAQRWVNVWLT